MTFPPHVGILSISLKKFFQMKDYVMSCNPKPDGLLGLTGLESGSLESARYRSQPKNQGDLHVSFMLISTFYMQPNIRQISFVRTFLSCVSTVLKKRKVQLQVQTYSALLFCFFLIKCHHSKFPAVSPAHQDLPHVANLLRSADTSHSCQLPQAEWGWYPASPTSVLS